MIELITDVDGTVTGASVHARRQGSADRRPARGHPGHRWLRPRPGLAQGASARPQEAGLELRQSRVDGRRHPRGREARRGHRAARRGLVVSRHSMARRPTAIHAQRTHDALAVHRQRRRQTLHQRGRALHGLRARDDRGSEVGGDPYPVLADHRHRSFNRYVVGGHLPIPKIPGAPVPTGRKVPEAWLDSGVVKAASNWDELAVKIGVPPAQLRDTAERFNELARKGHDDDFNRGDSVYDNYYGDPTLPNPNLYPARGPAVLRVPDHPRRSRHIGRPADRRIRPGAAPGRHGGAGPLRGGQHLCGGHGPQLCGCRGHHRPGHDVRLRRGETCCGSTAISSHRR